LYRYSKRLSWRFSANQISQLLIDKKRSGTPVLDLTVSNPTTVLRYPHSEIKAALGGVRDASYRPDPLGLLGAREAIANFYQAEGFRIETSRIALTASTSEAYALLFKLLCDPSDEVLIPAPSYPLFEYLAALENVRTVAYQLRYDGSWFIDFESLRERISTRSRAIVVVNPNNPTGSFLKSSERRQLGELASEHNLPLICDEVFMSYEIGSEAQRVKTLVNEEGALSFSLNGLSKMAAMPQMKLAWIAINGPEDERQTARERLEIILDTYLSVNTPTQSALPQLFEIGANLRSQLLARICQNLGHARQALRDTPVHVLHIEGGWSVLLQLPSKQNGEQWVKQLLEEENLLLQPGFFFDLPGEAYAVASLITEPREFDEGIERLCNLTHRITRC
jgi:aspartate/methionine/tyrosine aminotransferase